MKASSLGVIPRSLRAEQLKRLSFLCGLPVRGRKDELIARLAAAAAAATAPPEPSTPRPGPVVLSIDLGIRNLAFSLLTAAPSPSTPSSPKKGSRTRRQPPSSISTSPPPIKLHAWQRLSLLEGPVAQKDGGGEEEEEEEEDAPEMDTSATAAAGAAAAGAFAPAALAKTANAFLRDTVLRLDPLPTHVLIERQRWRSRGAAAVQEWTLRVNTLEAMLHASLRTLRDVGVWDGEVVSVRPASVGQLFLDAEAGLVTAPPPSEEDDDDDDDEEVGDPSTAGSTKTSKRRRAGGGGRRTSAETKKLKIALLSNWLGQGGLVVRPSNAQMGRMLDAYRQASNGAKRSRSKRAAADRDGVGETTLILDKKLDDLTDSLMQGMAWLRWQENMALLRLENGVEQLLG